MFKSFKSSSTSLIWQGVLGIIIGVVALCWPRVTILALVILFAIYAFITSGMEATRAFTSEKGWPVIGHLLLALIALAAGVAALVWPAPTALVLVLVIGIWSVVAGLVMFFSAFKKGEIAGQRALLILSGLVLIAFGVVLFTHPTIGALTIALLFGLFSIVFGITEIIVGSELRRTGKDLDSMMQPPDWMQKLERPDGAEDSGGTDKHPANN